MDSPADALLALSNTAAAVADQRDGLPEDDDRSSSLSELENAPEDMDIEEDEDDDEEPEEEEDTPQDNSVLADGDSEAETERLEESPDKIKRTVFQISPSKLAQSMNAADERPEIEELTNSEPSSPMTPVENSPSDELSDIGDLIESQNPLDLLSQAATVTHKRKRLSDVMDITSDERPRKRRTESVESEDDESEAESEKPGVVTREPTVEPEDAEPTVESEKEDENEPEQEQVEADLSDESKSKNPEKYTRSRSRRGKGLDEVQDDEDNDPAEVSDEDVEGDDVEATAKSEEEQVKRAAAMETLMIIERQFAAFRDKLYDEKISQLNLELSQLSDPQTAHPELLKQFECVNKHRDDKQDTEQKLLVFKVGALKRKSVAERSQIHSAYFQTVRDIRERHMERMSEHFYRIQRERFKSNQVTPTYTIPFPDKRIQQVTQQTAYNKEVSILSGVAKHVGFPAAPDLLAARTTDLEGDLREMGVSDQFFYHKRQSTNSDQINTTIHRPRPAKTHHSTTYTNPTTASALSTSAAAAATTSSSEQQFLEQTPWANPNHPIHRLGRHAARSPLPDSSANASYSTATPAHQKANNQYTPAPHGSGSASTIPENPTPQTDLPSSAIKLEHTNKGMPTTNGDGPDLSISPTETRRTVNNMVLAGNSVSQAQHNNATTITTTDGGGGGYLSAMSSPLQARASLLTSLNRTASRAETRSPFRQGLATSAEGGGTGGGGGMGRFGFR